MMVLSGFVLIVFFMRTEYIADSRMTIGLGFLITFVLLVIFRCAVIPKMFLFFVGRGWIKKRVVIIGAGEHGIAVCEAIENNPVNYFEVVGFCDDAPGKTGTVICGKPVLGSSSVVEKLVKSRNIHEVIIAITNIPKHLLFEMIDRCKSAGVVIHVISGLFSVVTEKMEAEEYGGLVTYRITAQAKGIVRVLLKRAMDLCGSAVLLILTAPLFALIAWAIKRDTPGPVFYRSEVVGQGEKTFPAYKFRSMIHGDSALPEQNGQYEEGKQRHLSFMRDFIQGKVKGQYFVNNESRVTKVGSFLRKISLDELPQLINVFRGEMSLVGPRFCSPVEYGFYKPWHKRRFRMKPGMTGLWQVRARSAVSYDDMVMLDLYYIENWSILFDIEILLRTIKVVLFGTGSRIQ